MAARIPVHEIPSADLSLRVNDRAMFHADNAYHYPAARIHSRRVRTDTVSNTAFRGFGGPQGTLFAERMMDAVAITLGLDPPVARQAEPPFLSMSSRSS